jgi:hypothetical protein
MRRIVKKYIVYGGYIDGQYVSPYQIARNNWLNPVECIMIYNKKDLHSRGRDEQKLRGYSQAYLDELIEVSIWKSVEN